MSDFTKAICGDWLNGKTVIVTGASGGMGAGIAATLIKKHKKQKQNFKHCIYRRICGAYCNMLVDSNSAYCAYHASNHGCVLSIGTVRA